MSGGGKKSSSKSSSSSSSSSSSDSAGKKANGHTHHAKSSSDAPAPAPVADAVKPAENGVAKPITPAETAKPVEAAQPQQPAANGPKLPPLPAPPKAVDAEETKPATPAAEPPKQATGPVIPPMKAAPAAINSEPAPAVAAKTEPAATPVQTPAPAAATNGTPAANGTASPAPAANGTPAPGTPATPGVPAGAPAAAGSTPTTPKGGRALPATPPGAKPAPLARNDSTPAMNTVGGAAPLTRTDSSPAMGTPGTSRNVTPAQTAMVNAANNAAGRNVTPSSAATAAAASKAAAGSPATGRSDSSSATGTPSKGTPSTPRAEVTPATPNTGRVANTSNITPSSVKLEGALRAIKKGDSDDEGSSGVSTPRSVNRLRVDGEDSDHPSPRGSGRIGQLMHPRREATPRASVTVPLVAADVDLSGFTGAELKLTVRTATGQEVSVDAKDDWKAQTLKEVVAQQIKLIAHLYFAIADVSDPACDRWLNPESTLKDCSITGESKLALKIKHWKFPGNMTDPTQISLFYAQVQAAIVSLEFAASEVKALRFASYYLQAEYGDYNPTTMITGSLGTSKLGECLPKSLLGTMPPSYFEHRLFDMHMRYTGQFKTPEAAKAKAIEIARTLPTYGLTFFDVTTDQDEPVTLAVAEDGMFEFSRLPERKLRWFLPFAGLRGWTSTETGVEVRKLYVLKERADDSSDDLDVCRYKTTPLQAASIVELLYSYFVLLVQSQERSETGRAKRLGAITSNAPTWALPPGDAYIPPPRRKIVESEFASRLEVFKSTLTARWKRTGEHELVKLWREIDETLDNNRWLETLDVSECALLDDRLGTVMTALIDALAYEPAASETIIENLKLNTLDFGNNQITYAGCTTLATILTTTPLPLQSLMLNGNDKISNKGAAALRPLLSSLRQLQTINLSNCDVGNKGTNDILQAVQDCRALTTLVLSDNRIDDKYWVESVGALFRSHPNLTHVDMAQNKITDIGMEAIIAALEASEGTKLEYLDMSDNKFTHKSVQRLCTWLESNRSMGSLLLGNIKLVPETGAQLARVLERNATLRELVLPGCNLGKVGGKSILDVVATNTSLLSLNLDNNGIDAKCGPSLITALSGNASLTSLSLRGNKLGAGKIPFGQALERNGQLVHLDMSNNGLKAEDVQALSSGLAGNTALRLLHLDQNGFASAGLDFLCKALSNNRGLHTLSVAGCKITDNGLVELAGMIKSNRFLVSLSLKTNAITNSGLKRVVLALDDATTLKSLYLQENKLDLTAASALEDLQRENIVTDIFV